DAFAERPFSGNPAAIVLVDSWPEAAWMQHVAAEMNQSETAFLVPSAAGWDLRWFTPAVEVDLCGHATLAAAFALWHAGRVAAGQATAFGRGGGRLTGIRHDNEIELDFPLEPQIAVDAPAGLADALGASPRYVGRSRFDLLVEVESEKTLRGLAPDFRKLA